jgi:hypothetical protein
LYVGKIIDQKIRLIFCKLVTIPCAGRDGNSTRAEGFAAGDVARRIADHVDLGCGELPAMFFHCPGASNGSKPIAVVMVVGKGAEFEEVPDAIVFQLQLRPTRDISSEKRQHQMRPRLQLFEQLEHAWKQLAHPERQFEREKMHIAVQKGTDIFVRPRNSMFLQDADSDPRIGHTRDFDIVKIISDAEALRERRFERMHAGATRMDKRSIDVEQEEALLHCCHVFFFTRPESVRGCICLATKGFRDR